MARVVETTQIAARVPVELVEQLQEVADKKDRTISYEVRQALKAHIEAHTPRPESEAKAS